MLLGLLELNEMRHSGKAISNILGNISINTILFSTTLQLYTTMYIQGEGIKGLKGGCHNVPFFNAVTVNSAKRTD